MPGDSRISGPQFETWSNLLASRVDEMIPVLNGHGAVVAITDSDPSTLTVTLAVYLGEETDSTTLNACRSILDRCGA
jgi:hypothetical protein